MAEVKAVRQFDGRLAFPFFGIQHPFSNFHPAQFKLWNLEFSCSEQAYVYAKFRYFDDNVKAHQVMTRMMTPGNMKRYGRSCRNFNGRVWDRVSPMYMAEILEAKYFQNPYLAQLLLSTGTELLVEASPRDFKWGIGMSTYELKRGKKYNGKNIMGVLLMETRQGLRRKKEEEWQEKPAYLRGPRSSSLEKLREFRLKEQLEELKLK
uniref:NADAR domain-containing protein n=1 Tax=Meloidogyne incognita TaxID=6306 RepID=A0A914LCV4_MELIC